MLIPASGAEKLKQQTLGRTRLSRFVDGLVGLDDVDEGRRLDEDFGLLAHGLALAADGDVDGRHSSGRHHRNLRQWKNALTIPLGGTFRGSWPPRHICLRPRYAGRGGDAGTNSPGQKQPLFSQRAAESGSKDKPSATVTALTEVGGHQHGGRPEGYAVINGLHRVEN